MGHAQATPAKESSLGGVDLISDLFFQAKKPFRSRMDVDTIPAPIVPRTGLLR